jgi:hypothetical protein
MKNLTLKFCQIERLPEEVNSFAHVCTSKSGLRKPTDGVNVYIILNNGTLLFANRKAVNPTKDKYLITHRSLFEKAKEVFSISNNDVVAAGEFHIIHGHVSCVNNRSGTFRGNGKNLAFATNALSKLGLKVKSNTETVDYSDSERSMEHFSAAQVVKRQIEVERCSESMKIKKTVESLYKTFVSVMPDLEKPGFARTNICSTLSSHNSFESHLDSVCTIKHFLDLVLETKGFSTYASQMSNGKIASINEFKKSATEVLDMLSEINNEAA